MIEQALMNAALGRFDPEDDLVKAHLIQLVEDAMVVRTDDGWRLTDVGVDMLTTLGWKYAWCRWEPWRRSMRPGLYETPDEARLADQAYCEKRQKDRALIRPIFVQEETRELYG